MSNSLFSSSNNYVLMDQVNNNNNQQEKDIEKDIELAGATTTNSNSNNSNDNNGEKKDIENGVVNEPHMTHFLLEEDFTKESKGIPSRYKKIFYILASLIIITTIVLLIVFLTPKGLSSKKVNVIFMIGDGMGPAAITLSKRAFKQEHLNLDAYLVGTIQTYSSSSLVTDSAAAATAYGSGIKTYNRAIGVNPQKQPVSTIIEAAYNQKGMRSGLVVTTRLTDATPAGFYAHSVDRGQEKFIGSQILGKGIDVLLGGGARFFPNEIQNQAKENHGYNMVTTREEMLKITQGKIFGLFSESDLPFEIDRINLNQTSIPTLAEMTRKALEILNKDNEKGFFLMVEGSKIDVAAHANDAASQIYETQFFDEAFQVALDFAREDGDTVIVVTADHETGGLTLGAQDDFTKYPDYFYNPAPLFNVTASSTHIRDLIANDISSTNTREIVEKYSNIKLTDEEVNIINTQKSINSDLISNLVGKFISKRCNIGWTTFGHTGVDVNLYGYFNSKFEEFTSNHENIELSAYVSKLLSLDMEKQTKLLEGFIPTEQQQL